MPSEIALNSPAAAPVAAAASKSSTKTVARLVIGMDILLIIVSVILGLMKTGNPSRYFGEGRFTMAFSCGQLLAVAYFAFRVYLARRSAMPSAALFTPRIVWLLMASGFVFLMFDEAFELHEKLDHVIHKMMHMRTNDWSDRIDDALIGVYGLIGLGVMWLNRRELLLFRKVMMWPLVAGFICLFLCVVCDSMSNGNNFLVWLTGDLPTAQKLNAWLSVGDGAFTQLGEGFFVVGYFAAWREALRLKAAGSTGVATATAAS